MLLSPQISAHDLSLKEYLEDERLIGIVCKLEWPKEASFCEIPNDIARI